MLTRFACDQAFFFSGSAKEWQRESRRSALPRKKELLIAGYHDIFLVRIESTLISASCMLTCDVLSHPSLQCTTTEVRHLSTASAILTAPARMTWNRTASKYYFKQVSWAYNPWQGKGDYMDGEG